jgi:ABC-2 type transport system ATP-binding protein
MITAIKITDLRKSYGKVHALKGVNLEIEQGEVFGLLGRNGAGKTTTINILTGFVKLQDGKISVFDKDVVKDYKVARNLIGIASQEFTLDVFFPVRKLLEYQAGYYGVTKKESKDAVDSAIRSLGLNSKENSLVRTLSGGMKRRLMIAKALVHNPQIIILDEPTAGVDVEVRRQIWELIRKLKKDGKTILLTTHYIEEAELLCDRVAIIDEGKIIKIDSPRRLIGDDAASTLFLKVKNMKELPAGLRSYSPKLNGDGIVLEVGNSSAIQNVLNCLTKSKIEVLEIRLKHRTLEDVFVKLTGRKINE